MRRIFFVLYLLIAAGAVAFAQQDNTAGSTDSLTYSTPVRSPLSLLDSVAQATAARDKFVADSLAMVYVVMPDHNRNNLFIDSLLKANAYQSSQYLNMAFKSKNVLGFGRGRPARDPWVIAAIMLLIIYTAFLNITSAKDMSVIFQSFYMKKAVSLQFGKEDTPITIWTFSGLFLLFGATFGLFLYLLTNSYYKVYYAISGPQLFFTLSFVIISLFAAKFLLLLFLGYVFNIKKLVQEYIHTLSLTYFNTSFVFLPLALCFSLIADEYIPYLLAVALMLVIIIFIWQYLWSSVNIISGFRFHKFYLFIYLCALEICPVLILIKALNIGFK